MADVEHDVDIFLVLEVSIKAHHKLVVQRPMDFNLTCKLLTRLGSSQVSFGHHFKSPGLVLVLLSLNGLKTTDFVALGKSSFSKESLSEVLNNFALLGRVIRVDGLALLFNDLQAVKAIKNLPLGNCSCQCGFLFASRPPLLRAEASCSFVRP